MYKKIGFRNQCLIALILGLLCGYYLPKNVVYYITPLGSAFLQLLKLIIVPLTFTTIVASFSKLGNIELIKKLGLSTLIWFVVTALIAATIGLSIGLIFHPGDNLQLASTFSGQVDTLQVPNLTKVFLNMVPGNLIAQISQGLVIPVIIFAIVFGIALTSIGDKAPVVQGFFNEFSQIMFKITRLIIRLSPIGIFALIAQVANSYGIQTLLPLVKFILCIYLGCILQILIYGILLAVFARKNPFKFFKRFWVVMITGFTTSSSLGTMPVTLEVLVDRIKVSKVVAGFVVPLGSTMKTDGCGAIYPALVCILTANMFHIHLEMVNYFIIIVTCAIATIGTAGVPGTASVMATVVLSSVGLPLQGLALVIGIDKIIDTMRTMTNVTGCGVCGVLVDYSYKKVMNQDLNE